MGKYLTCPFCGEHRARADEHVWAQWMHGTPGAVELLHETHGERIPREYSRPTRRADGRYGTEAAQLGPTAKWLPNAKVPVCNACNSGWMSRLEQQAKAVLGPFVLGGQRPLRLSRTDLRTVSTWATKSWMAYSLLRPAHQNPFTKDEYRSMASSPAPLSRMQIWLLHSLEPRAHVAMGIASALMGTDGSLPDLANEQDNWGYAYLAVSTVVLAMQLLPTGAPEEVAEIFSPPMLDHPAVRRIWPTLRPQFFPLGVVSDELVASLLEYPHEVFSNVGLPTVGLTNEDGAEVFQQFLAGANPTELRQLWNPPD